MDTENPWEILVAPSIVDINEIICGASDMYEQEQRLSEAMDRGVIPRLDNGFAFVVDAIHDDYIPAQEFTRYFSRGQVPLAAQGHPLRGHDIGHALSYVAMFKHRLFADLVQTTASGVLNDPELCIAFATALDGFGDYMRDLEGSRQSAAPLPLEVRQACDYLKTLVELGRLYGAQSNNTLSDLEVFNILKQQLGLDNYKAMVISY